MRFFLLFFILFQIGCESNRFENWNEMKNKIMNQVESLFSPELMNRIDESIIFHSLTEQNVYDIIDLQLLDLVENLGKLNFKLKLAKSAKIFLCRNGYDQRFGVRMLRRKIQKLLEDPISEMLLKQVIPIGATISVKAQKGDLVFDYKLGKNPIQRALILPLK